MFFYSTISLLLSLILPNLVFLVGDFYQKRYIRQIKTVRIAANANKKVASGCRKSSADVPAGIYKMTQVIMQDAWAGCPTCKPQIITTGFIRFLKLLLFPYHSFV